MKLVVVGKGGREHALAKKLRESPLVTQLWVCPGNPGMARAGFQCVDAETPDAIEHFCVEQNVNLVVVGPESIILSDLKKKLEAKSIFCFSPSQDVARLESSKIFCKQVLEDAKVLTAKSFICQNFDSAIEKVATHNFLQPLVIKADGLAQGKGVWVCENEEKARLAIETLTKQFGFPLLLEECLVGQELSAFALCDGKDFVILGTACDYKRISQDPFSANTGGMGAYSPCNFITEDDNQKIQDIFLKTLTCLDEKNLSYQGFLFAGLMKTSEGLFVLEYNVRMGDPETQALLPRIESDLAFLILAAVKHELKKVECVLSEQASVHVVAVSAGYPQTEMNLGNIITYPSIEGLKSDLSFAGVSEEHGNLVNSGGRVLGVTSVASDIETARRLAYQDIRKIHFSGMYMREDIGQ